MKIKKHLLTDFNSERWKGINIKTVQKSLDDLKEIAECGYLIGEIENPGRCDTNLKNASHSIKNLSIDFGKVYGDVYFFETENGEAGRQLIESGAKFGIRAMGRNIDNEILIDSIITWDIINN